MTNKKKLVAIKNKKLKKLGSGKRPFFQSYELDLQEIVSNKISSGLPINKLGVKNEMKLLLQKNTNPKYKNIISKFKYSYGWVNGFTNRFNLVLRKPTTEINYSKWNSTFNNGTIHLGKPELETIHSFQSQFHTLLQEFQYKDENILNLDETPTWFNAPINKTLAKVGAKHVPIKTLNSSNRKRITTILTASKDGTLLDPVIIAEGKSKDAITNPEKTAYIKQGIRIYKQKNNTNTSAILADYITNFLSPQFPFSESKLLIMDSFSGHLTPLVKSTLKQNNFHLLIIPGGFTKYLQPLDLTVNRSFKQKLKEQYVHALTRLDTSKSMVNQSKLNFDILVDTIIKAKGEIEKNTIINGFNAMLKPYENQSVCKTITLSPEALPGF